MLIKNSAIKKTTRTQIYSLHDPITDELRYVGKTVLTLKVRLSNHVSDSRRHRHRSANWIRGLSAAPVIKLLCEVVGDGCEQEKMYIALCRAQGYKLTNVTDGGDGALGTKHTPESRAKMSAARARRKTTSETRAKMSKTRKGRTVPSATRLKMSIAATGRVLSAESRQKIRTARLARKPSPHSAETRVKMSEAAKRRWERARQQGAN